MVDELPEAHVFNPWDSAAAARALEAALVDSQGPRERMRRLRERVTDSDTETWARAFLSLLEATSAGQPAPLGERDRSALMTALRTSSRARVGLDYDVVSTRGERWTSRTLRALRALVESARVDVMLFSSDERASLAEECADPRLWLVAESGAAERDPLAVGGWTDRGRASAARWYSTATKTMRRALRRLRQAELDETSNGPVLRYDPHDRRQGQIANALAEELREALTGHAARVRRRPGKIEVSASEVDFGGAYRRLAARMPEAELVLLVGGRGSEGLLAAADERDWTVTLERGASRARFTLEAHEVADLFSEMEAHLRDASRHGSSRGGAP